MAVFIVDQSRATRPAGARIVTVRRLTSTFRAFGPALRYHPPGRRERRPNVHHDSPSPAPGPRTRRFVAWTLRHGALLWTLALLAAIPTAWRTVTLYGHLRSDVEELLPRDAPSV